MQKIVALPAYLYERKIKGRDFYVPAGLEAGRYVLGSTILITMFGIAAHKQVNKIWNWIW
jgi:hypothetical protein